MAQETVEFSVIKQKIIKTDKILRMYQETSQKLKKVAQVYKEIKLKYDQAILNINRLELENERCTFNLENLKLNQDKLKKENADLQEQKTSLEDKYNLRTVQCQLEIKKLGDELRNIQEVKITGNTTPRRKRVNGTSDDSDKRTETLHEEIRKLRDHEIKHKKEIEELNLKNEKLVEEIKSFTDNRRCAATILKTNQNTHKEVKDLKRKIACLTLDRNRLITVKEENEKLKHQLMNQELILFDTCEKKSMSDFCTQTDIFFDYPKLAQVSNTTAQDTILNSESENKEIFDLKKKISSFIWEEKQLIGIEKIENEELTRKLMNQEMTLFDIEEAKSVTDFGMHTNILPRNKKRSYVQTLDSIKNYDLQETLRTENTNLRQSIVDYEKQVINLRSELEGYLKQSFSKTTQTEDTDLNTECFEEILKEMCAPIPMILSPMSPAYQEINDNGAPTPLSPMSIIDTENYELKLSSSIVPQVIITPPTPTLENVVSFDSNETASLKDADIINNKEKGNSGFKKCNSKLPYSRRVRRRKYRSPFISNEFIKLGNNCRKRPINFSEEMLRREIMKARKTKYQDCILKALQTLKKSKINFTISNESILPKCWLNSCPNDCPVMYSRMPPPMVNGMKSKTFTPYRYKNAKYLTEKLSCNYPSCDKGSSYMLLNKRNEIGRSGDPELLGFFDVKDESTTPSNSRIDNILENKPSSFLSTINSTLGNSEQFLETLAVMVSEKLKMKEDLTREVSSITSTNFESFNSETETELERLLEKPPKDVLKRNRLLLKQAQQNNRRHSTSSLEEEIDNRTEDSDMCNQCIENAQFDSNYNAEESKKIGGEISTAMQVENIVEEINTDTPCTAEIGIIDEGTQDSRDFIKFSTCPELISPLSSASKEMNTPPSNKSALCVNSSETQDSYYDPNLTNSYTSYVTEENTLNLISVQKIEKEGVSCLNNSKKMENGILNNFDDGNRNSGKFSPVVSPVRSNEESSNDNILHLRSLMNISACLSRLDEFLHKTNSLQTYKLNHGKSKSFDDTLIGNLEMQNLKHCEVDQRKFLNSGKTKFESISLENKHSNVTRGESAGIFNDVTLRQPFQIKREINFEEVDKIINVEGRHSVTDNKSFEDISSAPQSPVQEQVEFCHPVVIPLEKVADEKIKSFHEDLQLLPNGELQSLISVDNYQKKSEELSSTSCNSNQHSENKNEIELNIWYNEKSQPLDKSNQTTCTLSDNTRDGLFDTEFSVANKKSSEEKDRDKDTESINTSYNLAENKDLRIAEELQKDFTDDADVEEFMTNKTKKESISSSKHIKYPSNDETTYFIKKIINQDEIGESKSLKSITRNTLDTLQSKGIENTDITSCPKSPVCNSNQIISIENLECTKLTNLLFSPSSYSSEDKSIHYSFIKENGIKLLTSVILGQAEKPKVNKALTADILEALKSEENRSDSIPSCPQSPLNDNNCIDEIDITPPKIIPLNNLRGKSITNLDFHESVSNQSIFSIQGEEQNSDLGNVLDTLNENDSHTIQEVKTLPTEHKNSKEPQKVRRSERNLQRNKNVLELTPKKDDVEECACVTDAESCKGSVSKIKYKRHKVTDEISPPSQSLKNVSPEMVIQVKRKRGRPRKQVIENTEFKRTDTIFCAEDNGPLENENYENYNEKFPQKKKKRDVNCLEESFMRRDVPLEANTTRLDDLIETNPISKNNVLRDDDNTGEMEIACPDDSISMHMSNINNKRETLTKGPCQNKIKKRTNMTKLKSTILKQFREKRKMFQTNVDTTNFVDNFGTCDLKNSNLSKPHIDVREIGINVGLENGTNLREGCTTKECDIKQDSNKKKINIVQNILIPPNSNFAVDLLSRDENTNYEAVPKCDIRLDGLHSSSQSSITVENAVGIIDNIPLKKKIKRKVNPNRNNDILSKIMEDMAKGKPTISPNKPNKIKEDIPTSIIEREWRKNILGIAEITHNVPTGDANVLNSVNTKHSFIKNPKATITEKFKILLSRLVKLSSDDKIAAEVILEFKRHDVETVAQIILHKVSQDIVDKADDKHYPAPLMTKTQRILLNLMVHLENENVENVMDTFLTKSELFLFKIGCGIRAMVPVTRLYVAVCRLRGNVNRLRAFCCNAFLLIGDLAVPLLFTVLTSWPEILPLESELKYYPLTKVLVQIVYLKACNKPGYNLLPLRMLLHQFYGYPKERWNCDELFEELFQQYLRNPVPSDIAVRLLCKNKDTKWVYKKVNEFLKPLIYKIPERNVNFKATAIILIGKICKQFKSDKELDETYLIDLRRWLIGLTEGEDVSDIVERSVDVSLSMLPKKRKAKNAKSRKRIAVKSKRNTVKKGAVTNKKKMKMLKRFKRKQQ